MSKMIANEAKQILKFCFSVFIVTEIQIFADRTKYIKYINRAF